MFKKVKGDAHSQADEDPLRNFTLAGRLWIIACILLYGGAFITYTTEMIPTLDPGTYPILLFSLPVAILTLGIYAVGYWILQRCGVQLRKLQPKDLECETKKAPDQAPH